MGFFLSFIFISLFGFFSHYFYRKFGLKKGHPAWIFYFGLVLIGSFLIPGIFLYIGIFDWIIPFLNSLFPWLNIGNGKDLMWNSLKIMGIDWNIDYNNSALEFIAFILFFSYPLWYFAFKDLSRKLFGGNRNRPHEKGLLYFLTTNKGKSKSPKSKNGK
jgi:hypothetical protein